MFNAHTRVFNASSLPERTDGRTDRRRRVRKSHVLHACARGFNKFRTHLDLKKIKCTPINRPYTYIPTSHDWSKTAIFSHRPGPVRPFSSFSSLPFWRGSKKTPGTVSRCCAEASEATDGARDEAKGGGAQGDEPNGGYVARAHRDR